MSRFLDNLLIFGRVLRRAGIDVHPGRMLDVVAALDHVTLASRDEVYHACRALLVHRHEQIAIFDRVFAAFWQAQPARGAGSRPEADASSISIVEVEDVALPDGLDLSADAGDADAAARRTG